MADDAARSRLGRGLASLIGDVGAESQSNDRVSRSQRKVPIEHVRANPRNPRKLFSDAELTELSASIRERGIIQPIVVRARGADNFEIIAGERRWRAAQRANLHEVPIVVLDVTDGEALELAIIENVQRTDLNPLEEATGYQSLANEFNHSQDDIAKIVGKSRSHIANTMRLLNLPETREGLHQFRQAHAGHARVLISQPDAGSGGARQIVEKGLNVRQVEAMGQEQAAARARRSASARGRARAKTPTRWRWRSGCPMRWACGRDRPSRQGRRCCSVRYRTLEQLDEVIRRLESGPAAEAGAARVRRT